jgi:hypothetical protein
MQGPPSGGPDRLGIASGLPSGGPYCNAMSALPRLVAAIAGGVGLFRVGVAIPTTPSLLLAQQPAPVTGTAVISGVVIDGTTKTPVPGASMSFVRDTSDGIRMPAREILADAQGRFVFTAIPDGRFTGAKAATIHQFRSGVCNVGACQALSRTWVRDLIRHPAAVFTYTSS